MSSISYDSKVGDKVEHDGESGTITAMVNGVATIEIEVKSTKTVYVAMPDAPAETPE